MPRRKSRDTSFELPLLPRRRGMAFPNTAGPITAGRCTSLRMAEESARDESLVGVTAAPTTKRGHRPPIPASMKTFVLPRKNRGDLQGAAMEARREMRFMMASSMAEVLDVGLNRDRAKPAKSRGQESP